MVEKTKVPEAYKMMTIDIKLAKLLESKGLSDLKWMSDFMNKPWLREASTSKTVLHYFVALTVPRIYIFQLASARKLPKVGC